MNLEFKMTNLFELTTLRGLVEKIMDNLLSVNTMSQSRLMFDGVKPIIKNSDDAIFGFIYGVVFGKFDSIYATANRELSKEEVNEIVNAIKKRTMEIKSRIYETKT